MIEVKAVEKNAKPLSEREQLKITICYYITKICEEWGYGAIIISLAIDLLSLKMLITSTKRLQMLAEKLRKKYQEISKNA